MIFCTVDRCTSAFERNSAMLRQGMPNNALNLIAQEHRSWGVSGRIARAVGRIYR
jgi:hypothetical protein